MQSNVSQPTTISYLFRHTIFLKKFSSIILLPEYPLLCKLDLKRQTALSYTSELQILQRQISALHLRECVLLLVSTGIFLV